MKSAIMIISFLTIMTGCKYQEQFDVLKSLSEDREYLENNSDKILTKEKQIVIERYFSNVKDLTHRLVSDSRFSRYFHKRFFRYFETQMCNDFVLDKESWTNVLKTCEVDSFYLCAEEVKHYQAMGKLVSEYLTKLEEKNFRAEEGCRTKLVDLGVLNEKNN